jgi:hypothetical protein
VLVPVQFVGGLTSNASPSTNETKHPAEGSQSLDASARQLVVGWPA